MQNVMIGAQARESRSSILCARVEWVVRLHGRAIEHTAPGQPPASPRIRQPQIPRAWTHSTPRIPNQPASTITAAARTCRLQSYPVFTQSFGPSFV